MHKITSTKLNAQKMARLIPNNLATKINKGKTPNAIENISQKSKTLLTDKSSLINSNATQPALEISDRTRVASTYLAEQAAKANCQKLAEQKAANFLK